MGHFNGRFILIHIINVLYNSQPSEYWPRMEKALAGCVPLHSVPCN